MKAALQAGWPIIRLTQHIPGAREQPEPALRNNIPKITISLSADHGAVMRMAIHNGKA
jgi:hypothetical protein